MSDTIGRVAVPGVVLSTGGTGISGTQVFPLPSQFPVGFSVERPVIAHRFGTLDTKQEQRYFVGIGPRKFQFRRPNLSFYEGKQLRDFWESIEGPWMAFTYAVPNPDGSFSNVLVTFEQTPLSFSHLRNASQVGFNLVEVVDPASAPSYSITETALRFPTTALTSGLLAETQEIIPLIHIRVRESAVPDIYLSDRRVTVGGQLYLPRITGIGEAGSDVLISQDIKGTADNVRFVFGNADRVMSQLANDTDLKYASIDLCLFHKNSGVLLQLWKGIIQDFTIDGSPNFAVQCSDGFFQIMNQYPERQVSRQCWKTFNDGVNCPYAAHGSGGDPTSCDYYLESPNGCQAHGMSKYFGGQQADPQGVNIKDNSTGFLGFGRNNVTATSIISDTIWGLALPEIWCNSGGNPLYAFMAQALMVDYRDESSYSDSLGIVGAGPLGGFTQSAVVTNADGFRYVVAPMLDGFVWQGLHLDGNLNIAQPTQPGYGLRQILGNDPANPGADWFALGSGGGSDSNGNPIPETYPANNYAAGVAACEIRVTKPSNVQPSTPDQHQMTIPIDYGLSGWTWDASGNRTAVRGLTNPFWIAVNMLLRATGLSGNITVPLDLTSIVVTLPPAPFFGSSTAQTIGTVLLASGDLIAGLVILIGGAFAGNAFSVPMSNAANQAEVILRQNLQNWQNLNAVDQTAANKAVFLNNWTVVWNAYVAACTTIFQGDPNGSDAKKALNRSISDRQAGGRYDWVAYYYTPIASSPTPGDSITTPDTSAQQLAMFVLPSLVAGDGSGAAEIAALMVPEILGTGTETQFQFQGIISSQKPFRDWLAEVLNCALGYYTWQFGQLKLGCRINASAVDAYTEASRLFQSLSLRPIAAAFEKLVLSYADVAYAYQANTAEYVDKSHAAYYGRSGSPLTTQMHSVGCSTLNQALRIATTRTREEIGGINPTEWRDARVASWKTTLLGLGNEVGQVVSLTDPEIPGLHGTCNVSGTTVTWASGDNWNDSLYTDPLDSTVWYSALLEKDVLINGERVTITDVTIASGAITSITVNLAPGDGSGLSFQVITMSFRIQKWTLYKDYSVRIDGQTVTQSMYDLDVGPKPIDVAPKPLPALFYPIPLGPAWAPYQIQAPSWDAVFPNEWTFDTNQQYTPLKDGSIQADVVVTGKFPVNAFSASGAGAPVVGSISQSTTGGSLPASVALRVALCAIDSTGAPSAPSSILIIGTSPSGTDTFTLNDIKWPNVAGLAQWVLFISIDDELICAQTSGSLTHGTGGYTPTSITFGGTLQRSTWALPSPYVAGVRLKAKSGGNFGILGVKVDTVTAPATVVCAGLIDTSGLGPNLVGRILSVIGRDGSATPRLSVTITAYDNTTGTLTVSPQAVVSGHPEQSIQAEDVVIVRMKIDAPNTSNPTTFTDSGWINSQNAWLGLNVSGGFWTGQIVRVLQGLGRGETRKITSYTPTSVSWDLPLLLDGTSIVIFEPANWQYISDVIRLDNADYQHQSTFTVPCTNFEDKQVLIAGFTVDTNGNESTELDAPIREDWIYGEGAGTQITLNSNTTLAVWWDLVWLDASAGDFTVILPPQALQNRPQVMTRIDTTSHVVTVQAASGETVYGGASVLIDNYEYSSISIYHP